MDTTAQSSGAVPAPTTSDPNATATPAPVMPPAEPATPNSSAETPPPPPPAADPPATPMPADPPMTPEPPKAEDPAPVTPPATESPAEPTNQPASPVPTDSPTPPAPATETPKPEPMSAPVTPPATESPAEPANQPAAAPSESKPAETPAPALTENQTPPPPMQPQGKHWHISPWTVILILVLLGFAGFFTYVALSPKVKPTPVAQQAPTPTPIPVAQSVLSLQPAPASTPTAQLGAQTYDVVIDTSTNTVNAVQLELSYDPSVLTNVTVTPGAFFTNPLQLVKDVDSANGRISYALGIQPKDKGVQGNGVVAEIRFQFQPTATVSSTMLSFLPKTLVAAQGVNPSVLKSTTNATIAVPHQQGTTTQLRPSAAPPAAQY